MKRQIFTISCLFLFFSCRKDHSGAEACPGPSVPSGKLAKMTVYAPLNIFNEHVIFFTEYRLNYDSVGHLLFFQDRHVDSVNGVVTQDYTNMMTVFGSVDGLSPAGYDYEDNQFSKPPSPFSNYHYFALDAAERVLTDSNFGRSVDADYTYRYLNNLIVRTAVLKQNGVVGEYFYKDSLEIAGGDILRFVYYEAKDSLPDGQMPDSGYRMERRFAYGEDTNPLYDTYLAGSVGISLAAASICDLYSRHLPAHSFESFSKQDGRTFEMSITWTKDTRGRPLVGTGIDVLTGTTAQVVTFTYAP